MSERALLTERQRKVLQADHHDERTEVIDEINSRLFDGFDDELAVLDECAPEVFDRLVGIIDEHLANRYRDHSEVRQTS